MKEKNHKIGEKDTISVFLLLLGEKSGRCTTTNTHKAQQQPAQSKIISIRLMRDFFFIAAHKPLHARFQNVNIYVCDPNA